MNHGFFIWPLALTSGLALAQPALHLPAATITAGERESTGLDLDKPITSGSRLQLTGRENPASVSIADAGQIERVGARDFQEIANSLPGINAAAPPGHGGNIAYRGFNGVQINQLFNGISLQNASATRPVDSWIYDSVELIGGPSSFAHGSGSVGGTLNYITRLATREDIPNEVRLRYARFDRYELALGFNQALNAGPGARHYARLDFSHTSNNGYIDRQERTGDSLAFSLLSDLTPQLSHTLAIEYQEDQEDSPYWGAPTLNPQTGKQRIDRRTRFNNYNVADGRYEQRVHWLRSIINYQIAPGNHLRNTFYHYQGQRDYRNLEVYRYNADNSSVTRSAAYLQRHDQELNGNRLEWMFGSLLFGRPSDWAIGADISRNRQTRYPLSVSADLDTVDSGGFDPGSFDAIPGISRGWHKDRSNRVDNRALFIENRLQLRSDLALISALRYDHIDMRVDNHRAVTTNNPARHERRWDAFSGRLGLVWDVTDHAMAYVQYSTSAEPPGGTLTGANFAQVRDFDLSTGEQWEIGSKLDFLEGRGSATLALYRVVRNDFPITSPSDPNTTIPVGQQTSEGVEIGASFKLTERLLLEGNLGWVQARYDDFNQSVAGGVVSHEGNTPNNIPEQVANLWLTHDFSRRWQGGLDARYVSSVYADSANTRWVPSYTLYGGFLRYRLDNGSDLTLRARNLTDEHYARFIHQSNGQYYLGEPRDVELTLHARF